MMTTIQQLDEWMTANCYNVFTFGIGDRNISEGLGLEELQKGMYAWYYTERGKKEYLQYFKSEQEAVGYAFSQINGSSTALRHLVGFIKDTETKSEEIALVDELEKRSINYWKDSIPYDIGDHRIRVFVFGCDIKKVLDLRDKYIAPKFRF